MERSRAAATRLPDAPSEPGADAPSPDPSPAHPLPTDAPSAVSAAGAWQSFGGRLRHWRRQAGLTQAQLAAAIGYDHTAISRLEHGTRRASARLAQQLDELLRSGGELAAACGRAEESEQPGPGLPPGLVRPPLPREALGATTPGRRSGGTVASNSRPRYGRSGARSSVPGDTAPGEPGPGGAARGGPGPIDPADGPPGSGALSFPFPTGPAPARLPDYGLLCPLHGAVGCTVPAEPQLSALHAEFCADPAGRTGLDPDTAHALAGLLAAHLKAGERAARPEVAIAVERTLRAVLDRLAVTPAGRRRPLIRLAAEYAHAAGAMRMQHGRYATAMACFDRALTWSELAGDPATQVAALSDMSTLARLDGDAATALGYAREITRAAPGKHWAAAMGQVGQARAFALAGDVRATVRHIGRARLHLDHIGAHDETDAPWLSIASMQLRVESGAAAALRDVAAAVQDPLLALRAVDAAQHALDLLGTAQLPSTRLLFTVRIADCHYCAHDPQTAVSLLAPTLEAAGPADAGHPGLPALVGHELRGLRERLADRPELADTARRLAELAG
ncbi:helix-turn-helix domain-containing protein [Kitasatospora sp. NPDC096147]|uniref:helix-turn-helix domain-containing protein n=1 Tax=Kitasatospora sp. NPDC096147 TaxID=3364093 RepID=UPI00380CC495